MLLKTVSFSHNHNIIGEMTLELEGKEDTWQFHFAEVVGIVYCVQISFFSHYLSYFSVYGGNFKVHIVF
jgi:hypothetical protein